VAWLPPEGTATASSRQKLEAVGWKTLCSVLRESPYGNHGEGGDVCAWRIRRFAIHRSAWKGYSANFVSTAFSEGRNAAERTAPLGYARVLGVGATFGGVARLEECDRWIGIRKA
jgi:hypothetical protein